MNKRKRLSVLVFQSSDNWGGIESFISNIIIPLKERFDITVINTDRSKLLIKRYDIETNHFLTLPEKTSFVSYMQMLISIFSRRYDIIHFNKNSNLDIIALILAKMLSKAKIIVHAHNTRPTRMSVLSWIHYMNRPLVNIISDYHIGCSDKAANYMFGRNASSRVLILHNGIDTSEFAFNQGVRTTIRQELNIGASTIVVGNVGRLVEQKNQRFLIRIAERARDRRISLRVLIIGSGLLKKDLESEIIQRNLQNYIYILDNRTDINKLYQAMDVFVMPSLYEGLPIAAIEAQTSGLKLLVSDTITEEVNISGQVQFESLNSGADTWLDDILHICDTNNDRAKGVWRTKKAGYDRKQISGMLAHAYMTCFEGKDE